MSYEVAAEDIFLSSIFRKILDKNIPLIRYADKYPPRVRSLIGALSEKMDIATDLKQVKQNLNSLSGCFDSNYSDSTAKIIT